MRNSIRSFGFTNPVLIDNANTILAGHGRVEAARLLGMSEVPCVRLEHMTPEQKRAYVLADNKLALNAGWDDEILAEELRGLLEIDFNVELTGFSISEIDSLVEGLIPEEPGDPDDDVVPDMESGTFPLQARRHLAARTTPAGLRLSTRQRRRRLSDEWRAGADGLCGPALQCSRSMATSATPAR